MNPAADHETHTNMDIQQHHLDQVIVLAPHGRLDSTTAGDLEKHLLGLLDQGQSQLVVDFMELDYISSAGLRVLLMAAKRIKSIQGNLALCAMKNNIKEVFEMSGFDRIFAIYDSRDEATSAMPRPS